MYRPLIQLSHLRKLFNDVLLPVIGEHLRGSRPVGDKVQPFHRPVIGRDKKKGMMVDSRKIGDLGDSAAGCPVNNLPAL